MTFDRRWRLLLVVASFGAALDQWTKWIILDRFRLGESLYVLPIFDITYIRNKGAAFGFCHSCPAAFRDNFFVAVPIIAFIVILVVMAKLPERQRWVQWALSLIVSGAIGNFIDRVRFGYVVDFLYFHWGPHYWPAFNVADACIVVGVIMMFLHSFFPKRFGGEILPEKSA